jgi:hypothetical protein
MDEDNLPNCGIKCCIIEDYLMDGITHALTETKFYSSPTKTKMAMDC